MTTIELKNILIHKLAAINDKLFLAAMNTIIDAESAKLIYKITPEQRQRIKEGQEQFLRGETITWPITKSALIAKTIIQIFEKFKIS